MTRPFHLMAKPRGPICDLDCSYCFYLDKQALFPDASFRMSDRVLEAYVTQRFASQPGPEVVFAWQGGEPTLMGLEFFRRAVELQDAHAPVGVRVVNTLQTNGVSLDDAWCAFLKRHGFLVGLSLDGPAHLHDGYRVDKGGHGTHRRVEAGLALLKKHGVAFNVLTCVHAENAAHALEVYRYLRDQVGATHLQFIPVVEASGSRGVGGEAYGQFLITVFDEWVHRDVGTVFVQLFDVSLAAWLGQRPGLCVFEPTCGAALALEHNGDVFSCDHFVEPAHRLGNLMRTELRQLVDGEQQRAFGNAKAVLPAVCLGCEVRFVCNGGCPKNREPVPAEIGGLNVLCGGYRPFFNHIDPAMRFMVEALRRQAPPATIMEVLARGTQAELCTAYDRPG